MEPGFAHQREPEQGAMHNRSIVIIAFLISLVLLTLYAADRRVSAHPVPALVRPSPAATPKTIQFANYTWQVRSGSGGPGPNHWADTNVWVDSDGFLHLKITNVGGTWY